MPDWSHIYELHCKSEPCWILSPLREAKDWTCILMHISWVHYCWATSETEISFIIFLIRCFIYILWFSSSKEIRTNHLSSEGSTGGGGGAVLASVPTRSFKAALEKWDPSPKKGPCFLAERDEEQKSSLGTKGFVKKMLRSRTVLCFSARRMPIYLKSLWEYAAAGFGSRYGAHKWINQETT